MKRSGAATDVEGDVLRLTAALRTLHGEADRPREIERRRIEDTRRVQLRAFGYQQAVRPCDLAALAEAIEECPTLSCTPGHLVYINDLLESAQSNTRGALVIELDIPDFLHVAGGRAKRQRHGSDGDDDGE